MTHNMTCRNTRIELISILMFQVIRSANQISITTCLMADKKLIKVVRCFPCLWQVSSKSYKDVRTRENAWKEVASQITKETVNRNNILVSCYFKLSYHDLLEPLSKYRMYPQFSLFLLPSLSSVKQASSNTSVSMMRVELSSHTSSCLYEQH